MDRLLQKIQRIGTNERMREGRFGRRENQGSAGNYPNKSKSQNRKEKRTNQLNKFLEKQTKNSNKKAWSLNHHNKNNNL